ncbi:MAG: hypothetical protein L0H15_04870 [Nitrosospira sp.]|nr:hypothetical protein [Nitrosospira sp.]MDN5881449.1 hypothetical protein [Nitrosospira sp.]MDN5936288.1 hypothetical protein [Nitrosospira sp.]
MISSIGSSGFILYISGAKHAAALFGIILTLPWSELNQKDASQVMQSIFVDHSAELKK